MELWNCLKGVRCCGDVDENGNNIQTKKIFVDKKNGCKWSENLKINVWKLTNVIEYQQADITSYLSISINIYIIKKENLRIVKKINYNKEILKFYEKLIRKLENY